MGSMPISPLPGEAEAGEDKGEMSGGPGVHGRLAAHRLAPMRALPYSFT
jgi:hypothetical protein